MFDLATMWTVAGGAGVFGVLVIVITAQMRSQAASDRQHAVSQKEAAERAAKAIKDAEDRADAAEQREQVSRERADRREEQHQAQLDDALTARRKAEDLHGRVIVELHRLQFRVGQLEGQLQRFTQATGAEHES